MQALKEYLLVVFVGVPFMWCAILGGALFTTTSVVGLGIFFALGTCMTLAVVTYPLTGWLWQLRLERLAEKAKAELEVMFEQLRSEIIAKQAAQKTRVKMSLISDKGLEVDPDGARKRRGGRPRTRHLIEDQVLRNAGFISPEIQ